MKGWWVGHHGLITAMFRLHRVPAAQPMPRVSSLLKGRAASGLRLQTLIFSLLAANKQRIPDISSTQSEYPQLQQAADKLCRGNLLQPQELMGFLLILNRLTSAKYIYPVFPHSLGKEVNLFTLFLRQRKT